MADDERMTRGEFLDLVGRTCEGATHVVFVPAGRTLDDVLAEIATLGKLVDHDGSEPGEWAVTECEGDADGPCSCRSAYLSPTFTWHHNDVLVFSMAGLTDLKARIVAGTSILTLSPRED